MPKKFPGRRTTEYGEPVFNPKGEEIDRRVLPGTFWPLGGAWYASTPNGLLANLRGHTVTEHDDGTITVSPSIKVTGEGGKTWHGHLIRGVWVEAEC